MGQVSEQMMRLLAESATAKAGKRELREGIDAFVSMMSSKLYEALQDAKQVGGFFHYRLQGPGSRSDVTGKAILSPEEKKYLLEAQRDFEKVLDAVKDAHKKLGDFRKKHEEIDKVAKFI